MLKLSIQELLFRTNLEALLFILSGYLLSYKVIDKKLCFISSILLSISIYLIRILPIYYGVHTIINIIVYILTLVFINKIPVIKAIPISLITPVILSICEWINFIVLDNILNIKLMSSSSPITKVLYFMPSLILFSFIIFLFYRLIYINKKEGSQNVLN